MSYDERVALLLPLESAFCDVEKLILAPFFAKLCRSGCEIYLKKISKDFELGKRLRLYDESGFFALGEVREYADGKAIKMIKLFSL